MSFLLENYRRSNVNFKYGKGAYLFDDQDRKYLDFLSGIAVTGFGHSHPDLIEAAARQINQFWHTSNLFLSKLQEEVAEKLVERAGFGKVFFCNSGTEANEAALKFARKFNPERTKILAASGSFHGRTYGSLSVSGKPDMWDGFFPLLPDVHFFDLNDSESLVKLIDNKVSAVIIEVIQGENGIIEVPTTTIHVIKELQRHKEVLLIVDEVQTGMGRTGKFFSYQWYNLEPDIITLAKGVANGLPLGVVVVSEKIAEQIPYGAHGSTFGGNPVALSVASKVIDMLCDRTLDRIAELGDSIRGYINAGSFSSVQEIRGRGLMLGLGINLEYDAKRIVNYALINGLIIGTAANNTIRLLPPYIIDDGILTEFFDKFDHIFKTPSKIA